MYGNLFCRSTQKRSIDSVNGCLEKRGLEDGKTKKMVHDGNERQRFLKGHTRALSQGMKPDGMEVSL